MKWKVLSVMLLVLPCLEIWVLIHLTFIMSLNTIFLQCVITMVAGILLIQGENFSLWILVKSELLNNRIPTEEVLADLLLWCGGILLIVPGILTDAIGIIIFIPIIRQESIKWLRNNIHKLLDHQTMS